MQNPTSPLRCSETRPRQRTELPFLAVLLVHERSKPPLALECPKAEGRAACVLFLVICSPSLTPWIPHFEPDGA